MERRIMFNNQFLHWFVIGEAGTIELRCKALNFADGSIEVHRREGATEDCWLLGKCRHDGSYAPYRDRFRKVIASAFHAQIWSDVSSYVIWTALIKEYNDQFNTREEIDWEIPVVTKTP